MRTGPILASPGARLAAATARRYGGLIDLDGPLPVGTSTAPDPDAASRAVLTGLSGRWYEVPYRTVDDVIVIRHVVDADLLTSWLRHPSFRMVK